MKLSQIGEEALIERLVREHQLPKSGPGLVVGVGDDAAVLEVGCTPGELTLVTTDMLTEGMDFLPEWITPYQLGWKSVAANISDIAAMGGEPTWTFASIGLRPDTEVEFVDDLYRGMTDCAGKFGSALIGGDTNSVRGDAVMSITQMGRVDRDHLALRSRAKVGDRILVTGWLGDSRGGLELLLKYGIDEATRLSERLVNAHLMPMPRVHEARMIGGLVDAMMDISDGLGADLPKLCKASGVGALVYADRLPISDDLKRIAGILGVDVVELAASGGEEFELLMAVDPKHAEGVIEDVQKNTGTKLTDIGEIVEGLVEIEQNGTRRPIQGGWEHFH